MSEYAYHGCDTPLPSTNGTQSNAQALTQNLHPVDNSSNDCWPPEGLAGSGSQCSLQHSDIVHFAKQNLTGSPPSLLPWTQGGASEPAIIPPDEQELNGPTYFSSYPSGEDSREFAWTWPEQSITTDERAFHGSQMPLFEDYDMRMSNFDYPLTLSLCGNSTTALPRTDAPSGDDSCISTSLLQSPSPRAGNDLHIYEPVPSNLTRPSLLASWNDGLLNFQETSGSSGHQGMPTSWMTCDEMPFEQIVQTTMSHQTCSAPHLSTLSESPRSGSLPDLCCSRQQTPGSGPIDVGTSARPVTPTSQTINLTSAHYSNHVNQPTSPPGFFDFSFSGNENAIAQSSMETPCSRLSSILTNVGTSGEVNSNVADSTRLQVLDLPRRSYNIVSSISIPSPPELFANASISSRSNSYVKPSVLNISGLLPAIREVQLKPHTEESTPCSSRSSSSHESKSHSSRGKTDRPKRKRMHICSICGKDFNRPSALLLHSTVHTGERSNFCNVCGRSFSNLSNLRRHQRQLHVLESQMPLPEIPGPASAFSAYNFGSQTRF